MTTVTSHPVERSGPGIRAALAEHAPAQCAQFETDLRQALTAAAQDLDLTRVEAVLTRWYPRAVMAANPLTDQEREQIERVRAGDPSGLRVRNPDGTWSTL